MDKIIKNSCRDNESSNQDISYSQSLNQIKIDSPRKSILKNNSDISKQARKSVTFKEEKIYGDYKISVVKEETTDALKNVNNSRSSNELKIKINDNSVININQQLHGNFSMVNNKINTINGMDSPNYRRLSKYINVGSPNIKKNSNKYSTSPPLRKGSKNSINYYTNNSPRKRKNETSNEDTINSENIINSFYMDYNPSSPYKNSPRKNNKIITQPELMINIYKVNQKEVSSSKLDCLSENIKKSKIRNKEYQMLLNNPNYYKLVYDKKVGMIFGLAANTFTNVKGIMDDIIEVGINLKLKNNSNTNMYNIEFFSVFDGHGGDSVANELRLNLRDYILSDPDFINDTEGSLFRAFEKAENEIRKKSKNEIGKLERCGSCAIVVLMKDDKCSIANVGDSRAILSRNLGKHINPLSIDHKPSLESERKRIINMGGFVYLAETYECISENTVHGVYRTNPGKLSVSRTIGDYATKQQKPGVIIAIPDIISIKIKSDFDFIIIGSDGLYDKIPNRDATIIVLETLKKCILSNSSYNDMLVKITNSLILEAIDRESKDNISCIFICFDNLYNTFTNKNINEIEIALKNLRFLQKDFNDLYEETLFKKIDEFDLEKIKSQISDDNKQTNLNDQIENKIILGSEITRQQEDSVNAKKCKNNYKCQCVCNIF